jgi:hypothetical protein
MRGFVRRPELDWSPEGGVELPGFALPLALALAPVLSPSGSAAGR